MPNARLNERAPFFAEVDVLAAGTPAPRRVWGSDVSETGMFLQTTHTFRIGDRVSLRFDCADDAVHVRAAEVMWVRPFESVSVDGKLPGVGLKFVALDPPSRAALRKFVAPHLVDTTLPETPAGMLEALPPPVSSLPPITGSILAMTTRKHELTDEMFSVSLPPFSQPPLNISSPPDESSGLPAEVRVFRNTKPMGTPAPISIGPRSVKPMTTNPSLPPHPLAGWTFRRDDDEVPARADDEFEMAAARNDATVINASTLDLRFDDDAPGAFQRSLPPDEASMLDSSAFERSLVGREPREGNALGAMGDFTSGPPATTQIPDEDAIIAIESAVMHGDLAIKHLPIAEERRASRAVRSRSRALPVAMALLCSGTLVGVIAGTVMRRMRAAPVVAAVVPVVEARADAAGLADGALAPVGAAPVVAERSVADVEKELVPPSAKPLATASVDAARLEGAPSQASPVEAPVKTAARVEESAPVLTASVPVPAKATKAVDERRSIEVRVGSAKVLKAFTLGSPSRVVVDLQGGQLPKSPMQPGGGIGKVRFGTPAPGTGRVVVELEQDSRASDVEASIKNGVLAVTFR